MTKVDAVLSWLRASFIPEDLLLRRIDVIRGHRLDGSRPTVAVFLRKGSYRK